MEGGHRGGIFLGSRLRSSQESPALFLKSRLAKKQAFLRVACPEIPFLKVACPIQWQFGLLDG